MSNTPSETITPEDDDDQKATVENPRKTGIIPDAASFQQLQALEDAIDFRTARVELPCANCSSESEDGRCDDHAIDLNLIAAYQRTAKNLDAAMTAARERARAA